MATPRMTSSAGRRNTRIVILAAATLMLAVCVAGPWELGRAARHAQVRDACKTIRSLSQGLSDNMRATAASVRGFEQESRRIAATWRTMGAAIPERHSSGDDALLQLAARMTADNERAADQGVRFASEADQQAADLDARIASLCEGHGQ